MPAGPCGRSSTADIARPRSGRSPVGPRPSSAHLTATGHRARPTHGADGDRDRSQVALEQPCRCRHGRVSRPVPSEPGQHRAGCSSTAAWAAPQQDVLPGGGHVHGRLPGLAAGGDAASARGEPAHGRVSGRASFVPTGGSVGSVRSRALSWATSSELIPRSANRSSVTETRSTASCAATAAASVPLERALGGDVLAGAAHTAWAARRRQVLPVGLVAGQHRHAGRAARSTPGPCSRGAGRAARRGRRPVDRGPAAPCAL